MSNQPANAVSTEKLVALLIGATESTFTMMLDLPVVPGGYHLEPAIPVNFSGIVSIISFEGSSIGYGRIASSEKLACQIASAMLMTPFDSVTDEVLDAMGEMANLIIGNVKSSLEDEIGPLLLGIPTVISGGKYRTWSGGASDWIVLKMLCGDEELEIRFFIAPATKVSSSRLEGALKTELV